MNTRSRILFTGLLALLAACTEPPAPPAPVAVESATIAELQAAMAEGRITSREIVSQSLHRIAYYDGELNATLAVNPNALAVASRPRTA